MVRAGSNVTPELMAFQYTDRCAINSIILQFSLILSQGSAISDFEVGVGEVSRLS